MKITWLYSSNIYWGILTSIRLRIKSSSLERPLKFSWRMEFLKNLWNQPRQEYPKGNKLLPTYNMAKVMLHWNEDRFNEKNYYTRCFVSEICKILNKKRTRDILKLLKIVPKFDLLDPEKCITVFRVLLPFNKELRKEAIAFLTETFYTQDTKLYSEWTLTNRDYFIMLVKPNPMLP